MSVKAPTKWLTVCLHYNEPWEDFLTNAVKPYIDVVMQAGVAERFFFRRSWERGPNIRLWFKGSSFVLENMLKPNLKEHFLQYFESRPSLLVHPQYPAGLPEEYKWHPNNSVQFIDQDPELKSMGNAHEWLLCEKQFQASSQIVLNILKNHTQHWNYNEMISSAIRLHLSFVYASGFTLEEAVRFFQWMTENWAHRHEKNHEDKRTSSGRETTIRSFHKIFELQKKDIVPYHAALWELFKQYRKIEDPELIRWFHVSSNTNVELSLALESGQLSTGDQDHQLMRWKYFSKFISLVNNQLGIASKNEGYLFYVLAQSLQIVRAASVSLAKAAV